MHLSPWKLRNVYAISAWMGDQVVARYTRDKHFLFPHIHVVFLTFLYTNVSVLKWYKS